MLKQLVAKVENEDEPPLTLDVKPFKRKGITNPAVIVENDKFYLFARLIYVDGIGDNSAIVRYKLGFESGLVKVIEGSEEAVFKPQKPFGERGVEDLRVAKILGEDVTHAFLVHHDGFNARTEYLRLESSVQAASWNNFGVWFPNITAREAIDTVNSKDPVKSDIYEERWRKEHSGIDSLIRREDITYYLGTKDCSLWPRKVSINGEEKYGVIIRLLPDMQIVYVNDFLELSDHEFWKDTVTNLDEKVLLAREHSWEKSHIGLAGQPLEIDEGTLIFYHGVVMDPKRRYVLGAALADPENPQKIIARTPEPILVPTESWEREQSVIPHDGVLFPTSHHLSPDGKKVMHFYGASDTCIGYCEMSVEEILCKLKSV